MPTADARAARLERLLAVGRDLTAELDLEVLLERIVATARELTGARYAALGVLDERRRELSRFITAGADLEVQRSIGHFPRGRGILGLLIDRPQPIRLHDVSRHPRSYGFPPGHPPMRSFLGAPILVRGEAWGNLYLTERGDGEDFDDRDVEAVVVLAEWAAIAIDNARLYGEVQSRRDELERAVERMEAANDVALALGGETDLGAILQLIVKRGRAVVSADALLLWLLDGDDLRCAASAGSVVVPHESVVPVDGSTSGQALLEGRAILVDDVRTGMRVSPASFGMAGAQSALVVPLVYRGRALGVLTAFDRLGVSTTFDTEDERALQAFAASAATAVSTARTVEARRLHDSIAGAESERGRWARELHDETLQGMASLRLALASAVRLDGQASRQVLTEAIGQLEADIASLRGIIADLRPAALDELGLAPALRTLLERVARQSGLMARLDADLDEARLAAEVETVAYRVAQEALTNVAKHAGASSVELRVRHEQDLLVVQVVDDGAGRAAPRDGGYGLVGMRERAAAAGGELDIQSAPGVGTTVTLRLPLA